MLLLLLRLAGAWLRLVLGTLEWFHAWTVGPLVDWLDESVLAASEESVKLFVRECFTSAKRLINGFCAHLLGVFDRQYRDSLKLTWQQKEAWHSWWREERATTLNAVLAAQGPAGGDGGGDAADMPSISSRSSSFMRQRRSVAFSTKAPPPALAAADGGAASGSHHNTTTSSNSKGQPTSRQPSAHHIRWKADTPSSPKHHPAGCRGSSSGGGSRAPSAFSAAAEVAAAAAAGQAGPSGNAVVDGSSGSASSWLARAVLWALVGLQGRATTPPQLVAAATGRSTNPLMTLPSLPSMTSLVSLPSLASLRSWGSGGSGDLNNHSSKSSAAAAAAPSRLGQQQQHAVGVAGDSQLLHDQDQQQQQQQQQPASRPSLLQRLFSYAAAQLRRTITLLLLPFVAPLLPGLWLLGWLWARTRGSAAATPTPAAGAVSNGQNNTHPAQQQQQQQGAAAPTRRPRFGVGIGVGGVKLPLRSIVFEELAGFGAQEATRRRGLLEELSVTTELVVTATFDAVRWLVRALTLTRRHQQQRQSSTPRKRRQSATAAAGGAPGSQQLQHGEPGATSSSRRRSSSNGGSSSFKSRPSSPAGPKLHSPFASPRNVASVAAVGGAAVAGLVLQPHHHDSSGVSAAAAAAADVSGGMTDRTSGLLLPPSSSSYHSGGGCSPAGSPGASSSRSSSSDGSSDSGADVDSGDGELMGLFGRPAGLLRSKSVGADLAEYRKGTATGSSALPRLTLRRVRSVSRWNHPGSTSSGHGGSGSAAGGGGRDSSWSGAAAEPWMDDTELSAAAQCIMSAGYPLEIHTVTTADGIVLQMERIPRPGCGRVAFFLHGILDTSLTWVSSGVTGSQAFASWDQGFDVWLGSSRSNAPRVSTDPAKQGLGYFSFSLNELGIHDIPAQLDHLHTVKMREMAGSSLRSHGGGNGSSNATAAAAAAGGAGGSSSCSGSGSAGVHVDVRSGLDPWLMSEHQQQQQHGQAGDSEAVFGRAAAAGTSPSGLSLRQQQQQQQAATGWHSPRNTSSSGGSMKRTMSDSNVASLLPGRSGSLAGLSYSSNSPAAAAAAAGVGSSQQQSESEGKKRGGVLRAAGRLLRGAVRAGKGPRGSSSLDAQQQQQQQQQGQQQPWQTAAAMAAVVSAAAASAAVAATTASIPTAAGNSSSGGALPQQQQQQPGGQPAAATRFRVQPLAPIPGLNIPESSEPVNEPSTPDVIESPRRPEDSSSNSVAPPAAAAATESSSVAGSSQQQPAAAADDTVSPFSFLPGSEAEDAIAAAEAEAAATEAEEDSSSGWHSPRESAVPRLRSTGSLGTVETLRHKSSQQQQQQPSVSLQQQQQQRCASPRSCGVSSSAPGAPQPESQQQNGQQQPAAAGGCSGNTSNTNSRSAPGGPGAADASRPSSSSSNPPTEPYDLRVVAHSLGGLSMLVFCVMRAAAGQPHRVRRLVLLSPAGFHDVIPWAWWGFIFILPYWHRLLAFMLGKDRACHPALLPTYAARGFFFSGLLELARLPAMADFTRALMSAFFGGDASQWERALLMPHYSAAGMPACSLHQALHFIQIIHSGRFQLFDYGSTSANMARYGVPRPPDIAAQYWRLAGSLPVELMAGSNDGIIPPVNVRRHYRAMQAAGMKVTYREFAYGHMDFTFSIKEELRYHVMRALNANT